MDWAAHEILRGSHGKLGEKPHEDSYDNRRQSNLDKYK
jgi:hypothetical protein